MIKIKRYELNFTQENLAEKVGCHPNAIGRIERGQSIPKYTMILKIANALKISPKDLMPY